MKRNGMCPVCYLKRLFLKPSKISAIYTDRPYGNGVAETPPMGWSSWNTFHDNIDENVIYDTAAAMRDKGLIDAGYKYVNIDDNWMAANRDDDGRLAADPVTFPNGIGELVRKVNGVGAKLGIYTSNGTKTCQDLPSSLYHEWTDAYTFAKWGVEYFKYDFCHNIPLSSYAPLVFSVLVKGDGEANTYGCAEAKLSGNARFMKSKRIEGGKFVSGMDRREGAATYENITVDKDGEYVFAVNILRRGNDYEKCLMVEVNGTDRYIMTFPPQKRFLPSARFSTKIVLKSGKNTVKLFNPIATRADSAMLQYANMGKLLKKATEKVSSENGTEEKPIVFSLCEWGRNQPYKWGATAGNLWRTTFDINTIWPWIVLIYEHNVKLDKYACKGGYNDPDMLEVGNGKLTYDENVSHFSLWCMMNAPLILGNDIRRVSDDVLKIVANKNLIAINQDELSVQAHRIKRGLVDILVKPLADGSKAVCFFNKKNRRASAKIKLAKIKDGMTACTAVNQWTEEKSEVKDYLSAKLNPHGCAVYILK